MLIVLCIVSFSTVISLAQNIHGKSEGVQFVIGMSQANLYEPWRISMNEEIKKEVEKYKNIKIIFKDAGGDTDKQKKDIDDLVNSGIDLLIVSINDSQKLTPKVSSVYKSMPVIVLDRAVEGYDYTLYIGSDNESIGKKAGNFISDIMGGKTGNVIEVQGPIDSPPVALRSSGFKEALKENDNIKVEWTVIGDWQRDETEDKVSAILKEHKDINVIFAHSDYMALGAYKAAHKLGRDDVKIIGVDGLSGENGGIDLVSKGMLAATFTCSTGGEEAVDYAVKILEKKGNIPKKIILRSDKVTKDNVGEYLNKSDTSKTVNKKFVMGYAQLMSESKWRDANAASIKKAAKSAGIPLIFLESGSTQDDQKKLIRELIKKKVDVISFSPFVESGWDDVLKEAKEADIPVIISDRSVDSDDSLWMSNIGSDFYEEGKRAARLLNERFKDKPANIFEIRGNFGSTPTTQREKGFNDVIKSYDNYKITAWDTGDFTYDGGKNVMTNFLKYNKTPINAVYAQNDDMALGAIDALKEYGIKPGKDIVVIGTDATKQALKAVKRGEMYSTVECNALLGPQLIEVVKQIEMGKEVPLKIINSENIFKSNISYREIWNRQY